MIATIWHDAVAAAGADAYADYRLETGVAAYTATPDNGGVSMLRRDGGSRCEVVMLSLWESMDAGRAFAGDEPERAVFYPQDERFLVDRELVVEHYEVHTSVRPDGEEAER